MIDFTKLLAPFPAEAISWRAQNMKADGTSALALCYIDARDVMRRLDEACGPEGWQDSYAETPKGRLICTISILCDGEWIAKSDGAGDTDVEGEKGAISDAFKRAAVKWGIGRYLYDVEATWADCEPMKNREGELLKNSKGKPQFKKWTPSGLQKLAKALGAIAPAAAKDDRPDPDSIIADRTREWLQNEIEASPFSVLDVCQHFNVLSLAALKFRQVAEVGKFIKQKKAA